MGRRSVQAVAGLLMLLLSNEYMRVYTSHYAFCELEYYCQGCGVRMS